MEYIQIDNFNGTINIVCKDNGSGEPLIFDNLDEAQNTLEENCQDGQIIPLNVDLIYLIKEMYEACDDKRKLVHIGDLIGDILDDEDMIFP